MKIRHEYRGRREGGFSLVELMVALVIGLLLIFATLQTFVIGKRVSDQVGALSVRQEGMRFFSDIFTLHVRTSDIIKQMDAGCVGLEYLNPEEEVYSGGICSDEEIYSVYYYFDQASSSLIIVERCPSHFSSFDYDYAEDSCEKVSEFVADGGEDFSKENSVARNVSSVNFLPVAANGSDVGVNAEVAFSSVAGVEDLEIEFISLSRKLVIEEAVRKAKEQSL